MKRPLYAAAGVAVLAVAGWMIYQALYGSLVFFILPSEYAQNPAQFEDRRIRLGGIVANDSVTFDNDSLKLTFLISDSLKSLPVTHHGAPPELFREMMGVVVEGHFKEGGFASDNLLVRHTEVYQPDGKPIDNEALRRALY
ncbi:MAG: cytochrome c maturation protein CcmE [Truepera sp.]|nr:cytochrome c maturation protein CcmE [Truepera sp.]